MANKISPDDLPQSQIYENGEFYSISIADLKGNEVAIMQLINDYNTKVKTIERLQKSESLLASELQYQNASPFFAIISAITAVPFRNLPVRIGSAYSNRLTLSREQSC